MAIKNKVFWTNPSYKVSPPLKKDIKCKYLIVGGGITGVSVAYFLLKHGARDVVLIDKGVVAWGATGRAAGVLTPNVELDLADLVDAYGKKKGLVFWYGILHGLHHMKQIIEEEKIDCDYEEDPTLYGEVRHHWKHHAEAAKVLEEYKVQRKMHMQVHLMLETEVEKEIHTKLFQEGILSHQGVSVSPLKYTQNLAMRLKHKSVKFYEKTPLLEIKGNVAVTPKGDIRFDKIILATDSAPTIKGTYFNRSTIGVSKRLTDKQMELLGLEHREMVWDSKIKYHYFKLTKDNRLLMGWGDEKVKEKDRNKLSRKALKEILRITKRLFPTANIKFDYAWSASFCQTKELIPRIKFDGNRIFVLATSGQPTSTMVAKYVAQKLFGKKVSLDAYFK